METIDSTRIISEDLIKTGYYVATNKKNTLGLPQFHTQGVGNSVPDLFFWSPKYEHEIADSKFIPKRINQIRAGFIEVKTGDHLKELNDGVYQNTRYYGYFIVNKAIVSVEDFKIHNVDCFLLGSAWSRTGMLYKGDETQIAEPIPYISDRYNARFGPYTIAIHSIQRYLQGAERKRLRNSHLAIAANKTMVQTGILISKTTNDDSLKVSYDYYAWTGNTMHRLSNNKINDEFIKTQVKVLKATKKAIFVETRYQKNGWIPKSSIEISQEIEFGEWIDIEISRSIYTKKSSIFGIT